ncbi:DUF4123 domain-containing protein [Aidingimonas halophila]|uniref:DUF4123 domain-containing protein n=1 Tax=Aidingimonas halophila TaxID=574349 RepID=A0A1H3HW65_9GAMM|nr:DUF4123 domain-containing protein [Aidingimonas halophila]GHC39469.1 hypothetical protein GCM10008094_36200 [Aidingimonas halophila]SDY19622.1 protein of unknown function [Aidingimonas halophila]
MRYSLGLPEAAGRRYWLVETASLPEHEVLRRFYEAVESPAFRWLYEGTTHDALKDAGPILLDVTEAPAFLAEWLDAWGDLASVVIDAPLPIGEMQAHLAGFVTARLEPEGEGLLRFHEPMVLHLLLGEGLLSRAYRSAMLGSGSRWHWPICRCHDGWLFESAASGQAEVGSAPLPVTLTAETVGRLSGLQQLTRLMPVLAEALDRHALHGDDDSISTLWRELEHYWHGVIAQRLPVRKAVQALAEAERDAASLHEFRARMQRLASTE